MRTITRKPPSFPLHTEFDRGQTAEQTALLISQGKCTREKEPLKLKCISYLQIPVTQVSIMPECLKSLRRDALPFWLLLYKMFCLWEGAPVRVKLKPMCMYCHGPECQMPLRCVLSQHSLYISPSSSLWGRITSLFISCWLVEWSCFGLYSRVHFWGRVHFCACTVLLMPFPAEPCR